MNHWQENENGPFRGRSHKMLQQPFKQFKVDFLWTRRKAVNVQLEGFVTRLFGAPFPPAPPLPLPSPLPPPLPPTAPSTLGFFLIGGAQFEKRFRAGTDIKL
jgi:hypothetical protein